MTIAIYAAVGISMLVAAGPAAVAASPTPIASAVEAVGAAWAAPIVRLGAAVASLGALLALVAGIGRTALAMAREGDLPRWLAHVDPRHAVPDYAELAVAAAVALLVMTSDLRGAIGFSSFGVLTYYAIANAAAFTQDADRRRWPRWLNAIGFGGCLALVATLPTQSVVVGSIVLAVGLAGRWLVVGRRRRTGLNA
jgi:APA family basic amino acid/polyamine antiporter